MNDKRQMVEIWGDVIEIKSLVLSMMISGFTTMGAYFTAPVDNRTMQLFFGLGGAVAGFVLSTHFIKPKRIIILEDKTTKE